MDKTDILMAAQQGAMTRNEMHRMLPSLAVSKGVTQFAHEASQARKFHASTLGPDVDPECCLGDFLQLVADRNDRKIAKRYGEYCVKAALAESSGVTGGYAVPPTLRDNLMGDVAELAIFRPRAIVVPMTSNELELPLWDVTTATTKGVPPFWGGMTLTWISEASALPENEGLFRQLMLKTSTLGGTLLTSAPLLQDATGLENWLRRAFARSVAWYEDYAFVQGSGAGQPQGILNSGSAITVSRKTGSHFDVSDAQKMTADLYSPQPWSMGGLWLVSRTTLADITSQTGWIPNGHLRMHGMEIVPTMLQPPLGTKGDVILTDPSLYVIGDRQLLTIDASPHVKFTTNQWMWRVAERVDGQSLLSASITVPDGAGTANKVSPIVVLN